MTLKDKLICARFVNDRLCGEPVDQLFMEYTQGFNKKIMIGLCTKHSAENGVICVPKTLTQNGSLEK